ncbi:hypothetical protein J4E91_010789 [Alternaria rosae]|nr:hypothetical protein J4E91_010789 [Alternaria rosae]
MFHAIVQAGSARRDFDALCAWRNRELDTIEVEYAKILDDDKKCGKEAKELDRLTSNNYGEYDEDTFEWAMKRRSEVILRTRANDAQKVRLQEQQNDVYARHEAVETRMRDAEHLLWDFMDEMLVKIGVLSGINDADKNPRVQIVSAKVPVDGSSLNWSEDNWNDEIPGEWKPAPIIDKGSETFGPLEQEEPESTWNNAWKDYPRNDHLLALKDALYKTAEEATRVELEFNNVREQYDRELRTFMFRQRGYSLVSGAASTGGLKICIWNRVTGIAKNLEKNRLSLLRFPWMRRADHCAPRMFRWPQVTNVGESTDMYFEAKICVKTCQIVLYNSYILIRHGRLVNGCEYRFTGHTGGDR